MIIIISFFRRNIEQFLKWLAQFSAYASIRKIIHAQWPNIASRSIWLGIPARWSRRSIMHLQNFAWVVKEFMTNNARLTIRSIPMHLCWDVEAKCINVANKSQSPDPLFSNVRDDHLLTQFIGRYIFPVAREQRRRIIFQRFNKFLLLELQSGNKQRLDTLLS